MSIYDSIAAALDMSPMQLDFNIKEMSISGQIEEITTSESVSGSNNPMYGTDQSGSKNGMFGKRGELNPLYGKTLSQEHRDKMSAAHSTKDARDKKSAVHKGKIVSQETRDKMRAAKLGKPRPSGG
jgi:hypothetical protein